MMRERAQIVLSLSDFWYALKGSYKKIALIALLAGSFLVWKQLHRSWTYTAEAVIHGGGASSGMMSQAMQMMKGGVQSGISEDLKSFINSYTVMEKVVQSLNLQACLQEPTKPPAGILWQNLALMRAYKRCGERRPASAILGDFVVLDAPAFETPPSTVICKDVLYDRSVYTALTIKFVDEENYEVLGAKEKVLGKGTLNTPFPLGKDHFTLVRASNDKSLSNKKLALTFIPLREAAKSLQKNVSIKPHKLNTALTALSFSHGDKYLACKIVNQILLSYEDYLFAAAEEKLQKQMTYIDRRKEEGIRNYGQIVHEEKELLTAKLQGGGFLTAESELLFLGEKLKETRILLSKVNAEMLKIEESLDLPSLVSAIRSWKVSESALYQSARSMDITTVEVMIQARQVELEELFLKKKKYGEFIEVLSTPSCNVEAFTPLLEAAVFAAPLDRLRQIVFRMHDVANWTSKEREQLKDEYLTLKDFLSEQAEKLIVGIETQERVQKEKIRELKKMALFLRLDEHDATARYLDDYILRIHALADIWTKEKHIDFRKKAEWELLEALAKLVEVKQLSLHLQNSAAVALEWATPPYLPMPPRLKKYFVFGFVGTAFALALFFIVKEIFLGARASHINLKGTDRRIVGRFPSNDTPDGAATLALYKELLFALQKNKEGSSVILLGSQGVFPALPLFFRLLAKREERVLVLSSTLAKEEESLVPYLEGLTTTLPFTRTPEYDILSLASSSPFKEELLCGSRFLRLLTALREDYSWIFLHTDTHPHSIENRHFISLADAAIYFATHERLHELDSLPAHTLFLTQHPTEPKEFTTTLEILYRLNALFQSEKSIQLRRLAPTLEALKRRLQGQPLIARFLRK